MTITAKSTKAEILEALSEANAELEVLRDAYYTAQPISFQQLRLTWETVSREFRALVVDVYKAGAFCRKASQPLLDKAILIVNNDRRAAHAHALDTVHPSVLH